MEVMGFDWDGGNWPKCGKHGVLKREIEQLFVVGEVLIAPDPLHSTFAESRHIAAGRVDGRAIFCSLYLTRSPCSPNQCPLHVRKRGSQL